jgi:hypothetical protein
MEGWRDEGWREEGRMGELEGRETGEQEEGN